tara:strand:+ start:275 stop:583 length:309 start_codon:yes stop_codon:yes gene_type:complete
MSIFEKNLHMQAQHVKFNAGDMIIDHTLQASGFLVRRKRFIDIVEDDIYIWEINWFKQNDEADTLCPEFLEEESLKLSVVVGTVELYSKDGEYFESDYLSSE